MLWQQQSEVRKETGDQLSACCGKEQKKNMLKRFQKLEDGQVLEVKNWRIDGKKVRVTRREFARFDEECHGSSFMAQSGMWHGEMM